jgi:hypothetical protein
MVDPEITIPIGGSSGGTFVSRDDARCPGLKLVSGDSMSRGVMIEVDLTCVEVVGLATSLAILASRAKRVWTASN